MFSSAQGPMSPSFERNEQISGMRQSSALGRSQEHSQSSKQDTTTDSTTKAKDTATSEAAKEAVWMNNYIQELGVVPSIAEPVVIFCDNNGAIAQAKESRPHHHSKHILRCYHLLREMVSRSDFRMDRVSSAENTANPLTKPMSRIAHTQHLDKMGLRSMGDWL
ncbi:UNVERIFIED_CONTAM: Retrovirus-related Pol polyprotein from transposon RE2 [Sesamum radiatum]|uniref:Retrovirus-related Pol polyprotein from transposon RE2 n=1 Tax=Sesamum radiatum TaxID=300843 RepID=A0AAW2JJD6_SESRA